MNIVAELRARFRSALMDLGAPNVEGMLALVRASQDPRFGDYQANVAMPLGKALGRAPRDVAAAIMEKLDVGDFCEPPQIAGPGFINFRIRSSWLEQSLVAAAKDSRLGVAQASPRRTIVIDYSAPNVAKPMHVGHIRSTVIGDALYRTLKFLGHNVIGDNHLGDWGTQFGMIILGWKEFRDEAAYAANPVEELARLYRIVNALVEYYEVRQDVSRREASLAALAQRPVAEASSRASQVSDREEVPRRREALPDGREALNELRGKLSASELDPVIGPLIRSKRFCNIGQRVLEETARLHAGDAENRRLWAQFLPPCREAIEAVYRRLGVSFDESLGESFYHDRLQGVVDELLARGIARRSEGAVCIFLDGHAAPMIIQKQDGAFLYATTDLATIQYRQMRWQPDAILYVVDHRQALHFEQLFAVARLWGIGNAELTHVGFGTVLGADGRPFKTRSGDTVGLSGLLDEAVARALDVLENQAGEGSELAPEERRRIAEVVGIGALKYADLVQNRTSDYTFSYDKMLAMNGNTATYMQYAYARVRSIFAKGGVDPAQLRAADVSIKLSSPAEKALALSLARFSEELDAMVADYRPHQLTTYLFELAGKYSTFFEECPVLRAPTAQLRDSRLLMCDLTARTLRQGLNLLGIEVVEKM